MDTSNSQVENGWYIQNGFRVDPKELCKKEWARVIHDACYAINPYQKYLPFAPLDNGILLHEALWGTAFDHASAEGRCEIAASSDDQSIPKISKDSRLIPICHLFFKRSPQRVNYNSLGDWKINIMSEDFLLMLSEGFSRWVKCTRRLKRYPEPREREMFWPIKTYDLLFTRITEDDVLALIDRDYLVGIRILKAFVRLTSIAIQSRREHIAKLESASERVLKMIERIEC